MSPGREPREKPSERAPIPTREQVSAGGVAFRRHGDGVEIAIISVGPREQWQLPKGIVDPGETPEATAVREVREEAGIDTKSFGAIESIEYWYVGDQRGQRVRFHKFVHFFLLAYCSGDVHDHDREVNEAWWFGIEKAGEQLAFDSERRVVERAGEATQAALALAPDAVTLISNLALTYSDLGRHAEAIRTAERARALDPEDDFTLSTLGYVYGRAGKTAEAERALAALRARPEVSPYLVAAVYAGLGDRERAFQMLELAVKQHDDSVPDLGVDPVFKGLRGDPRFARLLQEIGLK